MNESNNNFTLLELKAKLVTVVEQKMLSWQLHTIK